ncbi:hypothetical protein GCM10020367_21190 [Streptomyces sannanensis]|uniref:Uncharacterized protein n=2 Tax=Streptomyces sannanensis TaxID=285536 RepID=A0ABP6S9X1_9ACTN
MLWLRGRKRGMVGTRLVELDERLRTIRPNADNMRLSVGLHDVGKASPTFDLVMSLGSGKSRTLLWTFLRVKRLRESLGKTQRQVAVADLARRLLASAEEATHRPAITSAVICAEASPNWGTALPSMDEMAEAAIEVEQLWLITLGLLVELFGSHVFVFGAHPPPHESSPCGVIRLASPLVPRAPGGPAGLPVSSSSCALAA